MCKFPEIPVGGRLKFFLNQWQKITQDRWVLSVMKEGLKLEFISKPPFSGVRQTNASAQNLSILQLEVDKLLQKGAIEPVPLGQMQTGFYSTFFLVTKKTGELRPVINLRPLNRYLRKQHFKMDCLSKVKNLVQLGDWAISLDLKDAYLHIPLHVAHRKYLHFYINGKAYQFTCLCFGSNQAPRNFTKIVTVIAAHLRMQNLRMAVYLDDWFLVNQVKQMLILNKRKALNLLADLGFLINLEKSSLIPSQHITYIGAVFHLDRGIVCPTLERIAKIEQAIHLLKKDPTALNFLHLLGLMASCIDIVQNARLYMRPLQLHLLHFWRPATRDLQAKIRVNKFLLDHFKWWLNKQNLIQGKCFTPKESTKVLTTDASKQGFGGHLENQVFQGFWTRREKQLHINCLELEAVFRSVRHFLPQLRGHSVLITGQTIQLWSNISRNRGEQSLLAFVYRHGICGAWQ